MNELVDWKQIPQISQASRLSKWDRIKIPTPRLEWGLCISYFPIPKFEYHFHFTSQTFQPA